MKNFFRFESLCRRPSVVEEMVAWGKEEGKGEFPYFNFLIPKDSLN